MLICELIYSPTLKANELVRKQTIIIKFASAKISNDLLNIESKLNPNRVHINYLASTPSVCEFSISRKKAEAKTTNSASASFERVALWWSACQIFGLF